MKVIYKEKLKDCSWSASIINEIVGVIEESWDSNIEILRIQLNEEEIDKLDLNKDQKEKSKTLGGFLGMCMDVRLECQPKEDDPEINSIYETVKAAKEKYPECFTSTARSAHNSGKTKNPHQKKPETILEMNQRNEELYPEEPSLADIVDSLKTEPKVDEYQPEEEVSEVSEDHIHMTWAEYVENCRGRNIQPCTKRKFKERYNPEIKKPVSKLIATETGGVWVCHAGRCPWFVGKGQTENPHCYYSHLGSKPLEIVDTLGLFYAAKYCIKDEE